MFVVYVKNRWNGLRLTLFIALFCLFSMPLVAQAEPPDAPPIPGPGENVVWLGVYLSDEVDGGVRVRAVVPGSPAALAGLRSGDLLIQVESLEIAGQDDLERFLARYEPGSVITVTGFREGSPLTTTVIPAVAPRPQIAVSPTVPIPDEPASFPAWVRTTDSTAQRYSWTRPDRELLMGMRVAELTAELRRHYGAPADRGVLVMRVEPQSPAAEAGVQVGDVITEMGRQPVVAASGIWSNLALWRRSEPLPIRIIRQGEPIVADLLAAAPGAETRRPNPERPLMERSPEALRKEIQRLEKRLEILKRRLSDD